MEVSRSFRRTLRCMRVKAYGFPVRSPLCSACQFLMRISHSSTPSSSLIGTLLPGYISGLSVSRDHAKALTYTFFVVHKRAPNLGNEDQRQVIS